MSDTESRLRADIARLREAGEVTGGRMATEDELAAFRTWCGGEIPRALRELWSVATDLRIAGDFRFLSPAESVAAIEETEAVFWPSARWLKLAPIALLESDAVLVGCREPLEGWIVIGDHDDGLKPVSDDPSIQIPMLTADLRERGWVDQCPYWRRFEDRYRPENCTAADAVVAERLYEIARTETPPRAPVDEPYRDDPSIAGLIEGLAIRLIGAHAAPLAERIMDDDPYIRCTVISRLESCSEHPAARKILERYASRMEAAGAAVVRAAAGTPFDPVAHHERIDTIVVDGQGYRLDFWDESDDEEFARRIIERATTRRAERAAERTALGRLRRAARCAWEKFMRLR